MNLKKLFDMQKKLDEKILERFPHLRNEDLLPKKILALQVELGELCNCWRGFKFWSHDQVPRTRVLVNRTTDDIGFKNIGPEHIKNPLLEEYVDCLHFILSIGLELGITEIYNLSAKKDSDLIFMFMDVNELSIILMQYDIEGNETYRSIAYIDMFEKFLGLGEMLGFTWEQIEEAYMRKNAINHKRMESGY